MPFQITYGTGRVAGFVGSDTVTLGSNPAVQVQRQGFGGVFDSSMDFLSASCDGLFVSPFLCERQVCRWSSMTVVQLTIVSYVEAMTMSEPQNMHLLFPTNCASESLLPSSATS